MFSKSEKVLVLVALISTVVFGIWLQYLSTNKAEIIAERYANQIKAEQYANQIKAEIIAEQHANQIKVVTQEIDDRNSKLIEIIVKKHQAETELAARIVKLAFKYEKEVFPKAADILAIISIESDFRPIVAEKMKNDPGTGLFQQRLTMWKKELPGICGSLDIEKQFQCGVEILAQKYEETGNKYSAVSAYNQGYGNYRKRGIVNSQYVTKFKKAANKFKV